jgi:PAS domain S-box-containing protein
MKIRTQSILTLVLFGIVFIIVAVLLFITHQQGERLDKQSDIAGSIEQITRDLSFLSSSLLLHGETHQRLRFEAKVSSLAPFLSKLKPDSPDQRVLAENIKQNEASLKAIYRDVKSTLESKSRTMEPANHLAFLHVSWSRMQVQIQGMISDALRLSQAFRVQEKKATQRSTVLVLALAGLFVAYFLFNFLLTNRRVLKSILDLQAGAEIVGSGNLDYTILVKHKDEIGELSDSFNRMATNLKETTTSKKELEREIAERKVAEEALRNSESKYRIVAENPYDWEFWINPEGKYVYMSPSCKRLTGREAEEFINDAGIQREIVFPEDLAIFDRHREEEEEEEEEEEVIPSEIQYRIVHTDGSLRWIGHVCKRIFDEERRFLGIRGSNRDITERKRAEEELRITYGRLQTFFDHRIGGIGIVIANARGDIIQANNYYLSILGCTREELRFGQVDWRRMTPPEWVPADELALAQLRERGVSDTYEKEYQRMNGSRVPVLITDAMMPDESGDILAFVLDITERKQVEEALQKRTFELQHLTETLEERVKERTAELANLSSQLVSAQEKERQRVSYDLHDNVWQILVAIRFGIENLFSGQEDWASSLRNKSQQIMMDVVDLVGKIRSMQGDLWPYVLDDIGLAATIDWYCREFGKNHSGLVIETKNEIIDRQIPSSAKIVIYRILQETLSNVSKHSQASRVALRLMRKDHGIEFAVEDDGIGFDPQEVIAKRAPWGGLGLLNIKARTELSGGSFGIESSKGKGTTVRASWPI